MVSRCIRRGIENNVPSKFETMNSFVKFKNYRMPILRNINVIKYNRLSMFTSTKNKVILSNYFRIFFFYAQNLALSTWIRCGDRSTRSALRFGTFRSSPTDISCPKNSTEPGKRTTKHRDSSNSSGLAETPGVRPELRELFPASDTTVPPRWPTLAFPTPTYGCPPCTRTCCPGTDLFGKIRKSWC